MLVYVAERLQRLIHHVTDLGLLQCLRPVLHQLIQVVFHELKNQMQLIILADHLRVFICCASSSLPARYSHLLFE